MFLDAISGLGTVLAIIVTFLATPPAYSHSIGWVQGFTAHHYGYGFEDLVAVIWAVTCGALIYFASRATIATALTMGALALATRIF